GYNAGERKIMHAIRRYGSNDYWVISRQAYLRPETRNYYPKMIAAALIAKNREQFGFSPASEPKLNPGELIAGDGHLVKVEDRAETAQPTPLTQSLEPQEAIAAREVAESEAGEGEAQAENSETEAVNPETGEQLAEATPAESDYF